MTLYSYDVGFFEKNKFSCNRNNDSIALTNLYESTNGKLWTIPWNFNSPINTWHGLKVANNGCVQKIDLSHNNLSGAIPDFSSFSFLTHIDLSENKLIDSLNYLSNLVNLYSLNLSSNNLSGKIPNFSNLPNLTSLYLSNNALSGSIPDFSNIPNLTGLSLGYNNLSGPIPDFSIIPNLTYLNLDRLNLSGTIPDFSNNTKLTDLSISGCRKIIGSIPEFSKLTKLERLSLSNDSLTGPLPDFKNHTNLSYLNIGSNHLSGKIPGLDSCFKLTYLDISYNNFGFDGLAYLVKKKYKSFYYDYQDKIFIDTTYFIKFGDSLIIDLKIDSSVTNNIYNWYLNDIPSDTSIIGSNKLIIPNFKGLNSGKYYVEIKNPDAPKLTLNSFDIKSSVKCSKLTDSLVLVDLYNTCNGPNWHKGWSLKNPMENWYGIQTLSEGCVSQVNLPSNNLKGQIPDFSNLPELRDLNLPNNKITGIFTISLI
ncbi:MAG: leucine-rich repeat domain-containing protein [Saprospiraceae bacterium]|nr:leucine-rich repeat domain-containing protein [Candidatus Vicinibacter affinis]